MKERRKILWLRISYWTAAIADFIIGISVLFPERVGLTEFVYPMGMMSAVAISWGILLLMANRKPMERRWILLPTIIVVALLNGVGLYAGLTGLIDFNIVSQLFGLLILLVLVYTYVISRPTKSN